MKISRRTFCSYLGAAGLAVAQPRLLAAKEKLSNQLCVIAYNIYAGKGWPEDREQAKKAVAEGEMVERLSEELSRYQPDIINFSESPSESITKAIAERMEMRHVRFPSGGNWPGTILSRYDILESKNTPLLKGERPKELYTRHWGRATIQLPGNEKLIVHSAHLFPTADPERRLREIPPMIESMRPDLEAGHSMLLMGDLNHTPDSREYELWREAGWIDTFAHVGKGDGFTIRADTPSRRIDYVMAAGPISKRIVESRPLFEGAFRLDLNDEKSFALSDHLPQLAKFQMAAP